MYSARHLEDAKKRNLAGEGFHFFLAMYDIFLRRSFHPDEPLLARVQTDL
jgi:hypothetical protein